MKKILCMAALAIITASCSKDNEPDVTPDGVKGAVAIRIGQTVQGLTKAPVVNGSAVKATVLMHDVAESSSTADWSKFSPVSANTVNGSGTFDNDADRATVSVATFNAQSGSTGAEVQLAPALYYAVETASNKSHLAAVSPSGTVEAKTVVMGLVDGKQDVMYAKTVAAGSSGSKESTIKLAFEHLTTQLTFKMKLTAAALNPAWNGKANVKSITIVDAKLPKAVDFTDGTPAWTDAALFTVPGINAVALATDAKTTGEAVMIQESGKLTLNVVVTGGDGKEYEYNNVVVKKDQSNDLTTVIGKSHEITLTVTEPSTAGSATAITTTATVKEWEAGDAGTGDLK